MRKLFVASVKMLYRDRQALFWAMAFPVIFTVVFGLFDFEQTPEVRISVSADAPSPVSRGLVEGLGRVEAFTVEQTGDVAGARRELEEGETDVLLAVPAVAAPPDEGPGHAAGTPRAGPSVIEVTYNETNFDTNQFALSAVREIVDGMNLQLAGVAAPPLEVREDAVAGKSITYYDFLLPGLVAMGVMNFAIIGMSVAIARFREQRILRRILATPLRPVKFLAAQVGARLLLSLLQASLILAVGVFVFGARLYGNVLWILVLATVANLIFLNIGFAVAGRASNPDAAQGLGSAISLPMMFLSGVFFPTDTLPQVMQTVVRFLPLTPLIEALRKVAIDGLSITDTGPQLALLGAWMGLSFVLAARSFRFARG